jgi:acetyl esterase/lipase
MIPGPRGEMRIRIYRPDMDGACPVVVFFHGSGFVICSIETHDGLCRQICLRAGVVVVSVDYALAPENPFPAGPDDALAAILVGWPWPATAPVQPWRSLRRCGFAMLAGRLSGHSY